MSPMRFWARFWAVWAVIFFILFVSVEVEDAYGKLVKHRVHASTRVCSTARFTVKGIEQYGRTALVDEFVNGHEIHASMGEKGSIYFFGRGITGRVKMQGKHTALVQASNFTSQCKTLLVTVDWTTGRPTKHAKVKAGAAHYEGVYAVFPQGTYPDTWSDAGTL